MRNYRFPKEFFFGGAFSANQTEGSHLAGGKGLSVADVAMYKDSINVEDFHKHTFVSERLVDQAISEQNNIKDYPKRRGNRFFDKYKEDIDLMAQLGSNAIRISIAWSRIYPTGNEESPNINGLLFYDNIIDELVLNDIEPIITLSHYEMPLHLARYERGWANRLVIDKYIRFCETLFKRYKDKVKYWIGFNEIDSILRHPFTSGGIIPDQYSEDELQKVIYQALHYQFVASAKATALCHEIIPESKMGSMLTKLTFYPFTCHPDDVLKAQYINRLNMLPTDVLHRGKYPKYAEKMMVEYKLDITNEDKELISNNKPDYLSFSYYMSMTASDDKNKELTDGNTIRGVKNPYIESSEWGWQIDSKGLRYSLIELYDRYEVPLMIVENGLGSKDVNINKDGIEDKYRSDYIISHLKEVSNSINDSGVDCIGYLLWSPIDSISASTSQISKRYGLVYVDSDDYGNGNYERIKKQSFQVVRNIYKTKGDYLNDL